MKIYNKDNIGTIANRYIFGPVQIYNHYYIDNGYIYGKDIIYNQSYYPINDDISFKNEVRTIGNKLYNLIKNNKINISLSLIGGTIIDGNTKSIEEDIWLIIYPFIEKYGLPLNYVDIKNNNMEGCNKIDNIVSLFILAYLTPLILGINNTKKVIELCFNLRIDINNRKIIVVDFYNGPFDSFLHPLDFKFRFIYDIPFFICHNLFAFAFKRIMFDLHDISLSHHITSTCHDCGKTIKTDTAFVSDPTRAHSEKYCDECKKLHPPQTQKERDATKLIKKIQLYKVICNQREILHALDKNNEYTNIYLEASNLTNYNKIGLTDKARINHKALLNKINNAIDVLKNKK